MTPSAPMKSAAARWVCKAPAQRQSHPSAQPLRHHGSSRGTFQQFGLGRAKIREMAFAGEIPGVTKASW